MKTSILNLALLLVLLGYYNNVSAKEYPSLDSLHKELQVIVTNDNIMVESDILYDNLFEGLARKSDMQNEPVNKAKENYLTELSELVMKNIAVTSILTVDFPDDLFTDEDYVFPTVDLFELVDLFKLEIERDRSDTSQINNMAKENYLTELSELVMKNINTIEEKTETVAKNSNDVVLIILKSFSFNDFR